MTIPPTPCVAIAMGSRSDLSIMQEAAQVLDDLEIPYALRVLSAHRTPTKMIEFGQRAQELGFRIIIAGAGGAAHLPGMLAAVTTLPVIGVPVPLTNLQGLDSLLSIVQMPRGVPVATVAIGNAANAAHLAARILALGDDDLDRRIGDYVRAMRDASEESDRELIAESAPIER